jgi:zinc ribbon protein
MFCPNCGTQVADTVKFCHRCGTSLANLSVPPVPAPRAPSAGAPATPPVTSLKAGFPWFVAGAAVAALTLLTVWRISTQAQRGGPAFPAGSAAPTAAATDISQMSPEERAYRLFERVMTHAERNQPDSMRFFLPMAIGAHQMLPAMDADARYHLGLLQILAGNHLAAIAQADTIARGAARHLFAYILRAQAYRLTGDSTRLRRAYRDYLANLAAERARQRPEYREHANTLEAFADTARSTVGGR